MQSSANLKTTINYSPLQYSIAIVNWNLVDILIKKYINLCNADSIEELGQQQTNKQKTDLAIDEKCPIE